MADKTKLIGDYKRQLNRNRRELLTAKGARKNAFNQISAPNLTDEERAKFRAAYKKYDAQVKRLETEQDSISKELNKLQAQVPEYDKEAGAANVKNIKDQYALLKDTYDSLSDKKSKDALSIKNQMDDLIDQFQKAYSESVGAPVSKAVAKANLTGVDLSTIGKTAAGDEIVTLQATKTAEETAGKEAGTETSAGKTPIKSSKTPTQTAGAGTFTEPMTIAGQVSTTGAPSGAKKPSKFEDLISRTEFWYNLPDYIFSVNPALKDILVKAVDQDWDEAKFLAAAQQTPWWQQNSAAIRTRIVDKAKYDELRGQGLDVSKTDYALDSGAIRRKIQNLAQQKGAKLSENQLDQIVAQAYNGFLENDSLALTKLISPYIGQIPAILKGATGISTTYSGEALQNYQALQNIARQNGFKLTDILPNISTATTGGNLDNAVLQKIANGELDVNAIAQNARMLAAAGQPQYVRDLLGQGYDLSAIYAPYRNTMASVLEINPDQIDLNDPTLRMGITDKGDMNLYDYNRLLRKDNRWQYTKQANDEASNAVQQVLKDFGFMG